LEPVFQGKPDDRLGKALDRRARCMQAGPLDDHDTAPYLRGKGVPQMMALPHRQVPETALRLTSLADIDEAPIQPDPIKNRPADSRGRSLATRQGSPETVGERITGTPPVRRGVLVAGELQQGLSPPVS
jgi:hypothetical protein